MNPADYIAVGGLLIALIGVWTNLSIDRRKRLADQRAQAYIDYLKTFVAMSYTVDGEPPSIKGHYDHLEARARVMLFASNEVLQKLEDLYNGPPQLSDPEAGRRFAELVASMQSDSRGSSSSIKAILRIVVYPGSGKP